MSTPDLDDLKKTDGEVVFLDAVAPTGGVRS